MLEKTRLGSYLLWACFVHSNMWLNSCILFLSPKNEKRKILAHLWSWLVCVQLFSLVGELSVTAMVIFNLWTHFLHVNSYGKLYEILVKLCRKKDILDKVLKNKTLFRHFTFNIVSKRTPCPFVHTPSGAIMEYLFSDKLWKCYGKQFFFSVPVLEFWRSLSLKHWFKGSIFLSANIGK